MRYPGPKLEDFQRQFVRYGVDLDARAVLIVVRAIQVGRQLDSTAEQYFQGYGLTTARYRILACLDDAGGELMPSEIAERIHITRATATGLIDTLERDGHVVRSADRTDGRRIRVVLSARGAKQLRAMAPEHFARLESIVSDLSSEERTVLLGLLERLGAGAETVLRNA